MEDKIDIHREEIIDACEKLYDNLNFKDITIKNISENISLSRPSIYNYFATKEEIFLSLLQREYSRWIKDLKIDILNTGDKLSTQEFARIFAKTLERRNKLLKLLSVNIYEIEANSSLTRLIEFKKVYKMTIDTISKCLIKHFPNKTYEDAEEFISLFLPFMFGIYPYTNITDKQSMAMKEANVPYKKITIYEIVYNEIIKILK